ncbi:CDP-diacylglycerol--glycerol-3-phosphate 3-phosphatidyltransferase [Novimethylophilus kurashikiensis]|uniref:CDP-diacylglycerol--glycerol-3-phosphate 3-phosphatidyltransferase n=1 Tax=Novimethylophilus kurashikiensis TaxID=1825523 RepID=A0A2R5FCQ0_9PROT|nr:CDP-diacylglycerol--glycerol-3-phosphate 3-phosphatidyltransferase [Novimethylophilus kurashikiensis]GBG15970.1 CDP-diacylglycerol--glycerol-3-phosphate 3-phosphatidyltransferase [Novimethylophilus kurashikiensis]
MRWNIPNSLTLLRILMIPVFVGLFYLPDPILSAHDRNVFATAVFALASITDWLDGYLARRLQQTSAFGAFLDPVADKLMVAAALIVLVEFNRVGAVIALIIIGREIAISALREWMAGIGSRSSVAVANIGKVKTALQMAAILFLLYFDPLAGVNVALIGSLLMYAAALLTLISMAYYLRAAWPMMREK